ncbi:tRNA-2-methylthio-N(6)-dimethylallyladenosine synthase [Candidatus Tiddalikarchaeum anstoanum]|nr:tRNA-2-methylthio-N(6)-dimethylallyladenosine synthase [Candidatus Tiddalikarchaeum anstoanum]
MKVYFETYGCSLNQADTLFMQGLVKGAGYIIVDNLDAADIVVVNTCTVKQKTEIKILKRIKSIKDKKVVVTGCLVQVYPELFKDLSVIGCEAVNDIVNACRGSVRNLDKNYCEKLNVVPLRKNKVVEIIPISQGCLGDCHYCQTKFARGVLHSYNKEDIVRHAHDALEKGAKELWLTSQDTGCYGFDINTNLARLINDLVKLDYDFRIRVGMMNPNHALKMLPELVKSFNSEKVYKFLHIPIQSGSDSVLKSMNRYYSISDFKHVIDSFKKEFPDITIGTDIICGYPTESEEDFKKSLELIKWLKPTVLNISRFWARPKTKAFLLKPLNGRITKERSRVLYELFKKVSHDTYAGYVNKSFKVLIDEEDCLGRTGNYSLVAVKGKTVLGKFYNVKITKISAIHLIGERV